MIAFIDDHRQAHGVTVADHLRQWLDSDSSLARKTAERYRQLAEQQIIPHLGAVPLQALKPVQVQHWHGQILRCGGKGGKPLSALTVTGAHRVLHRALQCAVAIELLHRNPASVVKPPKIEQREIQCLTADEIPVVLTALVGHPLYDLVVMALATGARRGELLALRWLDIDLDKATARIERSLEETSASGLKFKQPKTRNGSRAVSLPPNAVETLRDRWRQRLELNMALGLGRPGTDALVFAKPDGSPWSPDNISRDWVRTCKILKLPRVRFHSLRHSHASCLIANGIDVLTVSKRLGHGSATVTLGIYTHQFQRTDVVAAKAIEAAMRVPSER